VNVLIVQIYLVMRLLFHHVSAQNFRYA